MELSDFSNISDNPFVQFSKWYSPIENEGRENHNAIALSTAGKDGRVSSRMVLLKKYGEEGFTFFTNYNSRKGIQLSENPYASILFYWPDYGRQVRVEGRVVKISHKESDDYFNSRIHGHKLNALASNQSTEIPGRQYLIDRQNELEEKYRDQSPSRPAYWGGFRLIPDRVEFWEEGEHRFHNRLEYRLEDGKWLTRRLAP